MFLLLGLGKGNSAIKKYLDKYDIRYSIYDDNIDEYNNLSNICLEDIDCVVKTSGLCNEHFLVQYFKENEIEIITDLEFYYRYRKHNNYSTIITGSNGKSSTVMLIKHLIGDCVVAGNIGDAVCNYLEDDKPIIIEVSSYMAEYCFNCKADVVGYVNIYPNHLRHHYTFENYLNSKLNLVNNDDQLILVRKEDSHYFKDYNVKIYNYNEDYKDISFRYKDNMLLAIQIVLSYGIDLDIIRQRLKTFNYLEHRIEGFFIYNDIIFINDSKSTNFFALNCALKYYKDNKVLLIVGGKIKEEVFYLDDINNIKYVLINGENRFLLKKYFDGLKIENYLYDDLNALIDDLDKYLNGIDVVLFSPASESYDQFDNFEKRGGFYKEKILKKYKTML